MEELYDSSTHDGSSSTENLVSEIRKPSKKRVVVFVLLVLLLGLSIAFIVLYARGKTTETPTKETPTKSKKTCSTPECVISSSNILQNLDISVKACDDFYQYSCGGFVKSRHIGDEESSLDSFAITEDAVDHTLKDLLEDKESLSKFSKDPNSAVYKALTFYKSCMNESEIETTGTKPMIAVLKKYGLWNITNQTQTHDSWKLENILAHVFVELGTSAFISLDVGPNIFDTSSIIFSIDEGTFALFDEKPHLKHSSAEERERFTKAYKKLISRVFQLLGTSLKKSNAKAEEILDLQKRLYELKIRSSHKKPYFKWMTFDDLNMFTLYKFDWHIYFEEILLGTG